LTGPSNSVTIKAEPLAGNGSAANPITLSSYDYVWDYDGTSGDSFVDQSASDSVSDYVASDDWNLYSGSGTVTFTTEATSSTSSTKSGGIGVEGETSVEAATSVAVTYFYTIIPEPATFSLLALAGVALAARRRR
jgi:hypothetical protein